MRQTKIPDFADQVSRYNNHGKFGEFPRGLPDFFFVGLFQVAVNKITRLSWIILLSFKDSKKKRKHTCNTKQKTKELQDWTV